MKLLNLLTIAPLTMIAALPAAAQETPPAKPEKKICRSQDANTGTRMGAKRVCRTAAEWAEIRKAEAANSDRTRSDRDAM